VPRPITPADAAQYCWDNEERDGHPARSTCAGSLYQIPGGPLAIGSTYLCDHHRKRRGWSWNTAEGYELVGER
jgi:hypothetical protein